MMSFYRRPLAKLAPSITSAFNSALQNLSPPSNFTTIHSFSSLPKSSIINSPYSSYTWLLHPYSHKLYSAEHCIAPFKLEPNSIYAPGKSTARCVGSTRGWLCIADEEDYSLHLFHPFTNKSIKLPKTDPSIIRNFALSTSDPDSDENCILMAIKDDINDCREDYAHPVYCRPGKDDAWRHLPRNDNQYFDQVVYSSNDQMFYTSSFYNANYIRGWKVDYESMELKNDYKAVWYFNTYNGHLMIDEKPKCIDKDLWDRKVYGSEPYLVVDEASGDILLVRRHFAKYVDENGKLLVEDPTNTCPHKTETFDVYKLDFAEKRFQHLKSIGDRVLFLGLNEPFCLHKSEHMGLQRNSIYFTDDLTFYSSSKEYTYGGHDMGVFSLKKNKIKRKSCSFFAGLVKEKKIEKEIVWVAPSTLS